MRMQNWATALMSLLGPLVVCSTTFAQPAPGFSTIPGGGFVNNGGYPDPYLAQTPMNPGVFQPQFGTNTPPPALPPGALPYPAISPHLGPNVMQSQTFQQNGAWVNRIINRDRKWYGTLEYLHTDFEGPGGSKIGSRITPLDRITNDPPAPFDPWTITVPPGGPAGGGGTGTGDGSEIFNTLWIGPGAWPEVVQRSALDTELLIVEPENLFPVQRTTDILDDVMSSNGLRLRGGYFDADGTGLQAEFWWGFTSNDAVQFGQDNVNGVPITQNMIAGFDVSGLLGSPVEIDEAQGAFLLSARVGYLPLEDGTNLWNNGFLLFDGTVGTGITGTTQRYDLLWRVDSSINAGGGNLNFFLGDLYRRPHVSIKSYTGLKYMFIDEKFGFRGLDSGFGYEVDTGGDDGGGGTGGTAPTFRPTDNTLVGPLYPLFESILNSTVTSHLAGPEIGVRGDLGRGGTFGLWWQGAIGMLVNHERAKVQGYNIGNAYYFNGFDPVFAVGSISPAYDMFANDTSFDDEEQHTHVSPTLSVGINAELGILDTIPGLRRISLFDDARLNVGYNMQFIGLVARASDSIRWRGFPDFPTAQIDYDTFQMHQLSIGLHFER